MAKYTSTPIDFFLKLNWREGMAYFNDVAQLLEEEKNQMESSTKPAPFDVSAWHKWQR
jgi:hypothetical protein